MDLTPKQGEAWELLHDSTTNEILYGGSAGGGKSFLGCAWLMVSALRHHGSRWLMGRAVLKTLKETTLNTFFEVASREGLKAGREYTYNQQTGRIAFNNGSEILLKDLFAYPSDPNFDDLGSLELTGAFIDECNQTTQKARDIVSSRIRLIQGFDTVPKLLMTCNPARNWVYTDFYQPSLNGTLAPHRAFVPALVTDNPNISPHYIESLRRLPEADRERLLKGNWDYEDIPDALMDNVSIADLWTNEHVEGGKPCMTCDVARYGSDRTVIMRWDGLVVVDVITMQGASTVEVASEIQHQQRKHHVPRSAIVVDDDGIGGGVVDLLPGCIPFNNGARPLKDDAYANLKAQCYYVLADHVNDHLIWIQPEAYREDITRELSFVRRYKMDQDGKLKVWPKEKVKEALGRSPDFADALMMRMLPVLQGVPVSSGNLARRARAQRSDAFREQLKRNWR